MVATIAATARGQGGPDVDPDPLHAGMAEPRLAVDPNDERHWVGVADDSTSQVRWFTTFDAGATWSTGLLPSPGLAFLGAVVINVDGSVFAVATDLDIDVGVRGYRSNDGGLTWKLKALVSGGTAWDLAIDLSGGPHHGRVALVVGAGGDTGSQIGDLTSDDGGKSWSSGPLIFGGRNQGVGFATLAFGPGSELWACCERITSSEILVNHSSDGGATFDGPIAFAYSANPNGTLWDGTVVYDAFSIAVDATSGPQSGSVHVAYHSWDATNQRSDVRCLSSSDGGATWSDTLVNQGDTTLADQILPRTAVDPHGNLVVAFLDRRLDPSDVLFWTWLAVSSDGGTTFREYPLSDVGWDPSTTGHSVGMYVGMAATDHGVGALFPDGRSGQLDVLWDHANLSLVATPAQISAAAGNAVAFDLGLGPNDAGGTYWLLGSLATSPPFGVGHATVDLALDPFFFLLLQVTNTQYFANAMGSLDAQGRATATLDPQAPLNPALVGTDLFFAAVNPVPGSEFSTATIRVTIVP